MSDFYTQSRLPPGAAPTDGSYDRPATGAVSLTQIFAVMRRHRRIVLACTLLGAVAGGFLTYRMTDTYQATAVLRVAGERRALTGEFETTPEMSRTLDPFLSLSYLVSSRGVMGTVVDSLGLRLISTTPEFGTEKLSAIHVDSAAVSDTISVTFYQNGVKAKRAAREARARYGQSVDLGTVRFTVAAVPDVPAAVLQVMPREKAIDVLLSGLQVYGREGTDLIDVKYTSTSPQVAQQVVNTTVQAFQRLNIQTAKQKSTRRREFLEGQMKQTDSLLTRAQADLAAFRSRQMLASSQSALDAQQTAMMALEARRAELEADRSTFSSLQSQLKRGGAAGEAEALRALASSPALADNPTVGDYYRQLNNYQYRLDSMTTGPWKAAPTNPDLIQLNALIGTTKSQLRTAVSSHIATLDARINALRGLRERSGASLQVLPAMAEEEARLLGRVQALSSTSDQVRKDFQNARMAEEVEAGDVDVVSMAAIPYAPMLSSASLRVGLGLLLGLLLGTGGAFLLEAMNTSIRRPEDLEVALNVPGLAVIPRLNNPSQPARRGLLGAGRKSLADPERSLGAVSQPFSVGLEAFRMLRTSLTWCEQGDSMRTLVVTSAAPGEGKTMTAANLAVTFAYDGLRVLLVDCDVRKPRQHGLFQVPRAPGLMELLMPAAPGTDGVHSLGLNPEAGAREMTRSVMDVARQTGIRGLWLLTCGALPTNASHLLSGVRMRVLLQELARNFDLVILDTPPVLATADAGIVGSIADGVLLVVRAGQTDRVAAKRAQHQLTNAGARIVGTVLNDPGGEVSQFGDYYYPYDYAAEEQ